MRKFWERQGSRHKVSKARGKSTSRGRRNNLSRTANLGLEYLEPRWVLAAGHLDTTFAIGGQLFEDFGLGKDEEVNAAVVQADGKIVVAGLVKTPDGAHRDFMIARYHEDGSRDTSFGTNGVTIVNMSGVISGQNQDDYVTDVALDSLGRIVAVGSASTTNNAGIGIVRLNSNGTLDTTFNGTGRVTTILRNTSNQLIDSVVNAVAIDADGKILVGGNTNVGTLGTRSDFFVARYNTNGTLDTSFGGVGYVYTDFNGREDQLFDLTIQNDGMIVAVGNARKSDGRPDDIAIARYNTNGTLDTSFGVNGRAQTDIDPTAAASQDTANSVAILPNGQIVVAGFSSIRPSSVSTFTDLDFTIARYNADGSLDTSFAPTSVVPGTKTINFSTNDLGFGLLVQPQPDGKYVVGGQVGTTATGFAFGLARVLPNGDLDASFGNNGKVETPFAGAGTTRISELVMQPNGKIVAAGWATRVGGNRDVAMARYESGLSVQVTSINGPSDVNEGAAYTLELTSSDPTTTSWTINWGDTIEVVSGNPQGVTHVYADGPATYTISASATTSSGTFAAENTVDVTVHNVAPILTISGVANVNEGSAYTLNLSSPDPGTDTITSWTINWGDSVEVVTGNPASVTHVYADGHAVYTISATATDEDGTYAAGNTVEVTVNNVAPTLAISGASEVNEGAVYTLHLSSSDLGTDTITSWTINWGDSVEVITGNPVSVTHVYADGHAVYTISATATDEDGTHVAGNTVEVTVNNVTPALAISGAASVNEGSVYTLNLSSSDPGNDTITSWTINWGDSVEVITGNPASVTHVYADGLAVYTISATATDEDGTHAAGNTVEVTVNNVEPTTSDASFTIVENTADGTVIGTVTASDPGDDALTFSIIGGTGAAAFAIDPATGVITVANSELLDYETSPTVTLEVEVSDGDGGVAMALVTIDLLNQASISGVVYVDVNQNGAYDANEPGIDGVVIRLLDANGNAVLDADGQPITAVTSHGGFYLFADLDPGVYQLQQVQPTGVGDGPEELGSLGGIIVANDVMQLTLERTDAFDYAFAEIGQQVSTGDAATVGFWQNKHGQALITSGGTQLANWLTATFPNVFGNALVGASGSDVASFYREQLFKQIGKKSAGPAKVDAQFMAVAFAAFFTNRGLAGHVALAYGFNVTDTGIGTKIVNVGTRGAAFDVDNGTDLTILQLLQATDSLTDEQDAQLGFAAIYDRNGDGVIDSAEADLRTMANDVFASINELGGI